MQAKNGRNASIVEDDQDQDPGQEIDIVVVALVPDPGLVTGIGDLVRVLEIVIAEDDPGPDHVTMNVDRKPGKDHL